MTVQLNPAAEMCLTAMQLTDPEKEGIRTCISQYTGQPGIVGRLCWIVYRIINAVKSLFGISDWQLSEELICKRAERIAIDRGLIQRGPMIGIQKSIKERAVRLMGDYAKNMLVLIYATNRAELTEEFSRRFTPASLEIILQGIGSIQDELVRRTHRDGPLERDAPVY